MLLIWKVLGLIVIIVVGILASGTLVTSTKYIRTRNGKREEFSEPPPP